MGGRAVALYAGSRPFAWMAAYGLPTARPAAPCQANKRRFPGIKGDSDGSLL